MDPIYTKTKQRDDFKIPSDELDSATNTATTPRSPIMTGRQLQQSRNEGVVPDFIQKLFNMLESTNETSCYHWGPQGTTFVIEDTNEFAKSVLPRRFKHGNFSSFVRQLNKYDFHKIRFTDNNKATSGQQAWEFQHSLFQRDRKHLLAQIHRKVNNHRTNHRQTINKSSSASSSSSSASIMQAKHHSHQNSSDGDPSVPINMQHLHDIHTSLQSQIDKLSSTQQSMESTLGRLLSTDTLLLNEIQSLKRKMDEKDTILSGLLEQSKHHRPSFYPVQQYQQKLYPGNDSTVPTSSPMPSPQSPSLKLYPWLHPTGTPASSSSSSSTPTSLFMSALPHQKQPNSDTPPPSTITTPIDSTFPPIKRDPDVQQYLQTTTTPSPACTNTCSPPQPLSLGPSPPSTTQNKSCHDWRHRPKVLVVEDNVMYRRISMRCLQLLGCDFDMACDGLEAVACMKISKYDLILMDISIPKLDGMAATRKLRQYDQHTPVVSMTANYSDHDIDNYVGSGMSDLLPKPFDQHKLYDILKQHCAHLI